MAGNKGMARARRAVKQIAAKIVKLPTACAKVVARVNPDSFRLKSRKQVQPASGAHCTVTLPSQLAPSTPDNKVPQRRPKTDPVVVLTSEAHKFLGGTLDELARKDRKRKAPGRYSGDTFDTTPDDTASDGEGTPRKRARHNKLACKDRKRKAPGRYSGDTFDTTLGDTAGDCEGTPRKRARCGPPAGPGNKEVWEAAGYSEAEMLDHEGAAEALRMLLRCKQPTTEDITMSDCNGPLLLAATLEELAEEAALSDSAAQAKNHTASNACHGKSPPAVAGRRKRNTRTSKRALAA